MNKNYTLFFIERNDLIFKAGITYRKDKEREHVSEFDRITLFDTYRLIAEGEEYLFYKLVKRRVVEKEVNK
jgi:hypothetical protein